MIPLPAQPSAILVWGFVLLGVGLVALLAVVLRSWWFAVGGGVWLLVTGLVGSSGILANFSGTPPRIVLLLVPTMVGVAVLVFSRFGKRIAALPLKFLVGFMAFRIPVELLIHLAVKEGVAPPQMTWTGMNYDILAGVSALLLIGLVDRLSRPVILAWNVIALGLLLWIVGVAVLSVPTAMQRIEPDNVWIAHFPFVWLPTIAVTAALMGHLAIFRKLLATDTEDE